MKKIRLVDQKEIEIYNITEGGDNLTIDVLNGDATSLEATFSVKNNIELIQYYVGTDLIKAYMDYLKFPKFTKQKDLTISIDYSKIDINTESGFKETKADMLTIYLEKASEIEILSTSTEKNAADITYIAMEAGVEL